jgi:lysophospholipase L1-like esterase
MVLVAGVGATLALSFVDVGASSAAITTGPAFYVSLGGSGSVGEQPTTQSPHGQPTDEGYSNDLVDALRPDYPGLLLVKLGCPGETTQTMLSGGSHCHYRLGTELADAVDFLQHHRSTVLVTLDLGFNDLRPCLITHVVDQGCVKEALEDVHQQLSQILVALKSAGGPGLRIVGVGHYDPFLGTYLTGPVGRVFSLQSVDAVSRLNQVLRDTYAAAGVPMADVSAAFDTTETEATTLANVGTVPRDVERVCDLTWMCTPPPFGPNQHPNEDGYQVISQAIRSAMSHP